MNPLAYFEALYPKLAAGFSHPYTLLTSNALDAQSYRQGVLDVLRACPPPAVLSLVCVRWTYRQIGGWTCGAPEEVWIRPPS